MKLTIKAFASLAGRTPSAIRQHCRSGKIKADKPGRDWLIPEGELERYRESLMRPGVMPQIKRKAPQVFS